MINPRRIALLLNPVNHISPHLSSPEGEGQLLCFVIDWWMQVTIVGDNLMIINHKSICPSPTGEVRWGLDGSMLSNNNFYIKTKTKINPRQITLLLNPVNHFSPHLTSPEGEGQLLCFVKDWELQVTIVNDKSPIIRLLWVIIKLLWVIIR